MSAAERGRRRSWNPDKSQGALYLQHVPMSTGDQPLLTALKRAACDRCHAAKSRCSRHSSSGKCERCKRLSMTCTYSAPKRMGRPVGSGMTNSPRQCSASVMRTNRDSLSTQGTGDGGSSGGQASQQRSFRGEEDFTQSEQEACISAVAPVDGSLEHGSRDGCVVASVMKSCDGAGVLAFQSDLGAVSLGARTEKAFGTHESIEGN
jgi:hypothetical protein